MLLNEFDASYLGLARDILANGQDVGDRTGVGTRSVFGRQLRFNLARGFPLLTSKRVHTKSIIYELLWFLRGDTNIAFLNEHGVTIWDEWADENGELGPVYGKQWCSWPTYAVDDARDGYVLGDPINQITNVINSLRNNPNSRRHIVSAWNPAEVEDMALPPCHLLFQFYARKIPTSIRAAKAMLPAAGGLNRDDEAVLDAHNVPKYYLDCQLYQRSADMLLGVPFNIASYALLIHMVAQQVNMIPGEFVHTFGDVHIYRNHFDQINEQIRRGKEETVAAPPTLSLRKAASIFDYAYEDVTIRDYNPLPAIKAPIAV